MIGFAYPAYQTSLKLDKKIDDTDLLTYWLVFGSFNLIEAVLGFVPRVIPFYYQIKISVFIWSQFFNGTDKVYNLAIKPAAQHLVEALEPTPYVAPVVEEEVEVAPAAPAAPVVEAVVTEPVAEIVQEETTKAAEEPVQEEKQVDTPAPVEVIDTTTKAETSDYVKVESPVAVVETEAEAVKKPLTDSVPVATEDSPTEVLTAE